MTRRLAGTRRAVLAAVLVAACAAIAVPALLGPDDPAPAAGEDGRPPSAPGDPVADPARGEVVLRWRPSSDGSRIAHYNVWRSASDSERWRRVGSTNTTSYVDHSARPGASYAYGVRAVDAAGNVSGSSRLLRVRAGALDGSVFGPPPKVEPYAAAGAQGARFSLTNPSTHGAVVVPDPTGLPRRVIKLTTDEARGDGSAVRMQLSGRRVLGEGAEVWIVAEFFLPRSLPVLPPDGWMTLSSVYGAPHGGPGPNSIQLAGRDGRNYLHWKDEATDSHQDLWRVPATPGRWHVLARRMRLSSNPSRGFMEIWYAERGRPLERQTLIGPAAGETRRRYRTLEPGVNWDTDRASSTFHQPNSANLSNYHKDGMAGFGGLTSVYVAGHTIYPGTATARRVDPYYARRRGG